jgi:hypothetical protein
MSNTHISGRSAADCDRDAKRCLWEALNQRSEQVSTFKRQTMATSTHLIEPAAVLGPNHCPSSFPSSFLARAILCTLNGHNVKGESKNHITFGRRLRIRRMGRTPLVFGEVGRYVLRTNLTYLAPDVVVRVLSQVAIDLFASYNAKLRHLSIPSCHEEIGVETPAAAATAASPCPRSRTAVSDESRMGRRSGRAFVNQSRDVKWHRILAANG